MIIEGSIFTIIPVIYFACSILFIHQRTVCDERSSEKGKPQRQSRSASCVEAYFFVSLIPCFLKKECVCTQHDNNNHKILDNARFSVFIDVSPDRSDNRKLSS